MKTVVVRKRPFITGVLIGAWVLSVSVLGLLALWPKLPPLEKVLILMGVLLECLFLWEEGGVTFKQRDIGPWRLFWLLHPPFLLVWPRAQVVQRTLEEQVKFWTRYVFIDEIQCEVLLLRPWPFCLYKVQTPLL